MTSTNTIDSLNGLSVVFLFSEVSMWILEHSTVRDNKIYRHEYFEHDDGRIDWRVKTITVKKDLKPWELEMDLAVERSFHETNRLDGV